MSRNACYPRGFDVHFGNVTTTSLQRWIYADTDFYGVWYVVRAKNSWSTGTYDEGGNQLAPRQSGIQSFGHDCP